MESMKISDGIKEYVYGGSSYDALLIKDNIGLNGENLTIVILTYNRAAATNQLLQSIIDYMPNFAGQILIADNHSTKKELKKIEEFIANNASLSAKIISFEKNYGVAGGRNKIIDYVETSWLMNLDNDIYFIGNPLKEIYNTIALFGAKFVNLPLLSEDKKTVFSNGGSLFVELNNAIPSIGGGSTFCQCAIENVGKLEPSLSTFILGGASVLNKQAFIDCGKFDDNMFIGFEDIDFSITVFEKGLKIANCPTLSLVHNHTIVVSEEALNYEQTRFNEGILKKSADYFEQKRNFKIWDANVEIWLKNRLKDLGVDSKVTSTASVLRKPKIALVVDIEGWCFWNISCQIVNHLKEYYDFEIIPLDNIDNNIIRLFLYVYKFDLVHFFWRGHLSFIDGSYEVVKQYGLDLESFKSLYLKDLVITTSVYDHLYLDNLEFTNNILKYCHNYTVSSNKLYNIYNKNSQISKKPLMTITDGVDLELFKPKKLERLSKKGNLVIGWVGNSKWSNDIEEDFKGFKTILNPVIEELQKEGYPVETYYADKQERMIAHEDMPDYYAKIDVLICVSKMEGTPNPVLEAMACGVPIISSDVGIVRDALGSKQQKYILKNRTKNDLKEAIIDLVNNRQILQELSQENLQQIKSWDWKNITDEFKLFFDQNLKKGDVDSENKN